jgi:hypothetical protein
MKSKIHKKADHLGGRKRRWGAREEMAQTMNVHMNK